MTWSQVRRAILGAIAFVLLAVTPAIADAIAALQHPDRNFFDTGREQFEQEVERLQNPTPSPPALTIDESLLGAPSPAAAPPPTASPSATPEPPLPPTAD